MHFLGRVLYYYHFNCLTSPSKYNLKAELQKRGWRFDKENASFHDAHLAMSGSLCESLEFKHLLSHHVNNKQLTLMPKTYVIDDTNYFDIYQQLLSEGEETFWLLKPSLLNNGDGIVLFKSPEALLKHYQRNNRYGGEHVLQQYIHPPHLLGGHKYSLRFFVIITRFTGMYLYREGYFNVCREPYNINDINNLASHLTNEHLNSDAGTSNNYQIPTRKCQPFESVYNEIKSILIALFDSFHELDYAKEQHEQLGIFGFDFMLDENLKVWLIEANHGPCFPTDAKHPLQNSLYNVFWKNMIDAFVTPIARNEAITNVGEYLFDRLR